MAIKKLYVIAQWESHNYLTPTFHRDCRSNLAIHFWSESEAEKWLWENLWQIEKLNPEQATKYGFHITSRYVVNDDGIFIWSGNGD